MHANSHREGNSVRWFKRPEDPLIGFIGLLYVALIGRYNTFDLDSPWFLSFSYSYWVDHIKVDTFMLSTFPTGMGGITTFGKLGAFVQGTLLSLFGWTLPAATLVGTAFVLLSLIFFARNSRLLGYIVLVSKLESTTILRVAVMIALPPSRFHRVMVQVSQQTWSRWKRATPI